MVNEQAKELVIQAKDVLLSRLTMKRLMIHLDETTNN